MKKSAVFISLEELLELKKDIKTFSLSRMSVKNQLVGQQQSHLLARGMEFAESRRYLPGDDVRNIDWKVTARSGKAHTKLFTAEKTRKVILSVDMRSSMFFATKGVFKSVQAATLAAHIGLKAAENRDQVAGIIFDGESFFQSKACLGKKGVFPVLYELAERSKNLKQKDALEKVKHMDEVFERMKKMATPGSALFMISDFRHLSDFAKNMLQQMAMRCQVYLFLIYDQVEANFPKNGDYPVTDGEKELVLNAHDKRNLEIYSQQFLERKKNLSALASKNLHLIDCATDEDALKILQNQFSVKK